MLNFVNPYNGLIIRNNVPSGYFSFNLINNNIKIVRYINVLN